MATVTALLGASQEHRGLDHWMHRVSAELAKLHHAPDKDTVHDLRVAIRRCRSVGAVMAEIDPNPVWREMRHLPRKLFRRLGALRDAQIMGGWVRAHGAENDRLRLLLQEHFASREPKLFDDALRSAAKFDEKSWKRLDRKLRKRIALVPPGSLAAECLALERLDEARQLHARALRDQKPEAWHALRIGIKKFRYTVESFLPRLYQAWSGDLKRVQDVLGEMHDLDVLSILVQEKAPAEEPELLREWLRRIERERNKCLDQYAELACGKNSFWTEWTDALPRARRARAAAMARIRATARAAETHPRRTAQNLRIAIAVFDAFRHARVSSFFCQRSSRSALRAAARLSGVTGKNGSVSRKSLWRFLNKLPAPPSWTASEWRLLAWAVRYHRRGEPRRKNSAFAELPAEQQQSVRALAGVLRLARGLRKCGVQQGSGFRAHRSADAVLLEAPGLADSAENTAHLATAKRLLESYLQLPLILKPAPKTALVTELPAPRSLPEPSFAVASD
jgi:CHAD domain-containing protein